MIYIKNLDIETFKGIKGVTLSKFGDINILVGDNNTCKTTVLEAIQVFQYPNDFREIIRIARKRDISSRRPNGVTVIESFLNMFNASQQNEKQILLECEMDNYTHKLSIEGKVEEVYITREEFAEIKKYQRVKKDEIDEEIPVSEFRGVIKYDDKTDEIFINEVTDIYRFASEKEHNVKKLIKMKYVSSIDHLNESFSIRSLVNTIKSDDKSQLLDLLFMFDSNIVGIEMMPGKSMAWPSTYIKHSEYGFMPLSSFGDGVKKVLTLASALINSENGVLLIDEIETAIHTSALEKVFTWLLKACKRLNIQIFATTHSDEALRAMLMNFGELNIDMCVYRLERLENEIIARRFSGDKAFKVIIENGGDLR
ncbi:ATP-binding protein [Clostridium estertheticum]|uniref:AAA family ATPase n=1 Tax=Clostridium estertheticum TaxID=238834 RepID=UPI001C0E3755|nr:ATP-binding protein [Clostridium estertheticum]MBU3176415.1 ATP-binding protein [Clostridium estertheticum]